MALTADIGPWNKQPDWMGVVLTGPAGELELVASAVRLELLRLQQAGDITEFRQLSGHPGQMRIRVADAAPNDVWLILHRVTLEEAVALEIGLNSRHKNSIRMSG